MTEKGSGTAFTAGLLIGAAVGLAIGFLYAPRPGVETRAILKEKTEKVREQAAGIAEKVKETAVETKQKAQEKYQQMKGHTA